MSVQINQYNDSRSATSQEPCKNDGRVYAENCSENVYLEHSVSACTQSPCLASEVTTSNQRTSIEAIRHVGVMDG